MEEQQRGGVIHLADPRDVWPDMDFEEVCTKVKLPDTLNNHMFVTSNPTGPNIFYKNFINSLNNQENGK